MRCAARVRSIARSPERAPPCRPGCELSSLAQWVVTMRTCSTNCSTSLKVLGSSIIFQPVRNSLFVYGERDGTAWELEHQRSLATFARIEAFKRAGRAVANQWSSLRHFRNFPFEARPPCAAGWILCTMDPEGVLFHCGERDRSDRSNNVTRMGVARAFANLTKSGCGQCWCARSVEENYIWGLRFDRMLPPSIR